MGGSDSESSGGSESHKSGSGSGSESPGGHASRKSGSRSGPESPGGHASGKSGSVSGLMDVAASSQLFGDADDISSGSEAEDLVKEKIIAKLQETDEDVDMKDDDAMQIDEDKRPDDEGVKSDAGGSEPAPETRMNLIRI